MIYALDTDTISFALRNEGKVRSRLDVQPLSDIGLPAPCRYELLFGALSRGFGRARMQVLERFVDTYETLPLDAAAADHAAAIDADLARGGAPIGAIDVLIAGVARARGLTLVTHNAREFGRVPGLMTTDWY